MRILPVLLLAILLRTLAVAQPLESKPANPYFPKFHPLKAPAATGLLLKPGDRLAICGDSITEQKMYSRIMEDYLTVCVPQLGVTVRQYGWSGERAPGFLRRMTNDCLRFHPTIATTCYGMNDHEYRPYEERIGQTYREKSFAIVEAFKANGVRVVLGSPGCVGKIPFWVKSANGTVEDLNLNLCNLRNIDIEIARQEQIGFADVFWPRLNAGFIAQNQFGTNYAIAGKDGVHPGWAGHAVMAFAFLKALGLRGDIGTFTVDLSNNSIQVTSGHEVIAAGNGEFELRSSRYPFCPCLSKESASASYPACETDDPSRDDSIRSAMNLIPFNQELNRLVLIARHTHTGSRYKVSWGIETKSFSGEQLGRGINLASEFQSNPFLKAFAGVDAAVAAKQAFETKQIKEAFRSPEANTNFEAVVARTEKERAPLVGAIQAALVPVTHTIRITPE
jgi:lysophospholipase L1-like esterase